MSAMLSSRCLILKLVSWWYFAKAWLKLVIFFSGSSFPFIIASIIANGVEGEWLIVSGPFPLFKGFCFGSGVFLISAVSFPSCSGVGGMLISVSSILRWFRIRLIAFSILVNLFSIGSFKFLLFSGGGWWLDFLLVVLLT